MRLLIGVGTGAAGGALLGYFGKCASGACPLTANPLRGALLGAVLGGVIALSLGTRAGAEDALAGIPTVAPAEFEDRVLKAPRPVLVDFYADWCTYCRQLAPTIAGLADEYAGRVDVVKVDGDRAPQIIDRYAVGGYPTVLVFTNGEVFQTLPGVHEGRTYRAVLDAAVKASEERKTP